MKSRADFQKEFTEGLRRPLLPAPDPDLDPGLAIYNRQYWLRFLNILQAEYPLLVRLLGAWEFNLLMQEFLSAHPPADFDVQLCAEPLPLFLQNRSAPQQWQEAAQFDQIRSQVLLSPDFTAWQLTPELAANLGAVQLHAAPTWRIFRSQIIQRVGADLVYRTIAQEQAVLLTFLREVPIGQALERLEREYPEAALPQLVQTWMALSLEWGLWSIP